MLRENPYLSFVSVFGTALAITLIMMMIIADRSRVMNMSPENHRDPFTIPPGFHTERASAS